MGQLWGKSSLASSQQTKIHQEWEKAEGYIFTVNSSVMIRVGKIIFVKGQMQLEREKKKKKKPRHINKGQAKSLESMVKLQVDPRNQSTNLRPGRNKIKINFRKWLQDRNKMILEKD